MCPTLVRRFLSLTLVLAGTCGFGQPTTANSKATIAVGPVTATPALRADMADGLMFNRVVQSMDGHITSTLTRMGKFQVVVGSDLNDIFQVGAKGDTGVFDLATVPEAARIKLPKFLLITSVDHFLAESAAAAFRDGVKMKRRFQISAQAKIYDTTTGEILAAPDLQVEKVEVTDRLATEVTDAMRTDEMMPLLARELSEKIAWRTADEIFPAKIIKVEEQAVTLNRGDLFAVAVGDVMDVFGPVTEVRDPDSGEVIKTKGKRVGMIRVTEVEPTYSQGEITEGTGVVVGSIVKKRGGE